MAKFSGKTFTFTEIQKFYRVPISCSDYQCFLNVGKNSIVKVHDQKPLHTWTLTHPYYFTCPVVYYEENLYCVTNNKALKKWSVNEDTLRNSEKIKFQESIFAVIPIGGRRPIIILNSGKYAEIDYADSSHSDQSNITCLEENEELVWADATFVEDNLIIFCVVFNEKNSKYTVCTTTVNNNKTIQPIVHRHTLLHKKAVLKDWCLNKQNASFLSIWSDGKIFHHNIKEQRDSQILHIKSFELSSNFAVTNIDESHIAVAFNNTKLKECVLEIYDTKFSVLKAQKVLKCQNPDSLQITVENFNVYLYLNKEITSIPFQIEVSSLAAAVGKSISEINQAHEFSWDSSGKLEPISKKANHEPMDTTDIKQKSVEETVEMIAQRLRNQKSQLLMYIPESELARLLQLALQSSIKKSSEQSSKDDMSYILNVIFSASFNDIFLVKYLKRMNLEETLVALELLHSYLNHTIEIMSDDTERPTDLQIINWICLIIQSHMEALLLSKDKKSKRLLRKLDKILNLKIEEYEDYEGVQNYFTILQKRDVLPEKYSVGKYSIETLNI